VDGMDVFAVYRAAAEAVARARDGGGPSFIECRTYRYVGHQTAERVMNLSYRTEAEIEEWRGRDALEACSRVLLSSGAWTPQDRSRVDAEVEAEIEEGIAFARQSSWPNTSDALNYMYASPYPDLPAKGWEA
jgi:TPP-dependent pyruvate/acetoin dehydrogenase alpha subunit